MLTKTTTAGFTGTFRNMFKARDIFLHDGRSLRRFRITPGVQLFAVVAAFTLLLWSVLATAQLAVAATAPAANPAEVARMQREVQAMQADVAAIKAAAQRRLAMTEAEIRRLGLQPERIKAQGVGGPYEPVETAHAADPNFKALFTSWKKLEQLEQGTVAIPSTEPVHGTNFTSGFGVRSDPFKGRAAMHPGIDLAGPYGTPIYATADGTVLRAGWNSGGYGNLVEVDHGRGITTRYGHMSAILVSPGDHVTRGQQIGRMGSTGRSTGNHLHYEVRIDGRAVNPIPFMKSTDYVLAMQRRSGAASMDAVAIGGPNGGQH